jgi:hypothetical protein
MGPVGSREYIFLALDLACSLVGLSAFRACTSLFKHRQVSLFIKLAYLSCLSEVYIRISDARVFSEVCC